MSKARSKGTAFETAFTRYLVANGLPANRTGFSSPHGDVEVSGLPIVFEGKNCQTMTLAAWVDQATRSAERTHRIPVVFHKRKGKGVADCYITMPAWALVKLLKVLDLRLTMTDLRVDL
jgi:hypothetical protein